MSVLIPDIEWAMTLVGSTIDPAIGFFVPIIFYWKSLENDNVPTCSCTKITAIIVAVFVFIISILALIDLFMN